MEGPEIAMQKYTLIGENIQLFESNCSSMKMLIKRMLEFKNLSQEVSIILIERLTEDQLMLTLEDLIIYLFPVDKEIIFIDEIFNINSQKKQKEKKIFKFDSGFYETLKQLKTSFFDFKAIRNRITHTDFHVDWWSEEIKETGISGIKTSAKKNFKYQEVKYNFDELDQINDKLRSLREALDQLYFYFGEPDKISLIKKEDIPIANESK